MAERIPEPFGPSCNQIVQVGHLAILPVPNESHFIKIISTTVRDVIEADDLLGVVHGQGDTRIAESIGYE